jgi:osmoprotectant transport system substrate-binding protein
MPYAAVTIRLRRGFGETRGCSRTQKLDFYQERVPSMTRRCFIIPVVLFLVFFQVSPGLGCVGRILNVAVADSPDQIVMGHMLSVLINERTGTTVNVVPTGDLTQCREAVFEGKAQIYIGYIGVDQDVTKGAPPAGGAQELYTLVSQYYREKYGMIWLQPFGFEGPMDAGRNQKSEKASLAAPVCTKEVLRKFPVLDRVINKLGRSVDDKTIAELVNKVKEGDPKDVVKAFLKANKLI